MLEVFLHEIKGCYGSIIMQNLFFFNLLSMLYVSVYVNVHIECVLARLWARRKKAADKFPYNTLLNLI